MSESSRRRTQRVLRGLLGSLLTAFVLSAPSVLSAQTNTEIVRGRVFAPDSTPVAQAELIITGLSTQTSQTARTDARGVFTAIFGQGEGDYLVAVRKVGYASQAFRVTRTGLSNILARDVYLKQNIRVLDTVTVSARADATTIGTDRASVGEMSSATIADAMFLAEPGNLMALILSLPGVYLANDSTFSVLGADPSGNLSTLDGAFFRGGQLPPDAIASVRVITSAADPAKGAFSGGNISTTLKGGTDIFAATLRGSTYNRTLAWSDPLYTNPMPRVFAASGTANGPIRKRVLRYNVSWSFNDRTTDWFSLANPRQSLLSQYGILLDSVNAVTDAMRTLGIPRTVTSIPRNIRNYNYNTSEVLDFTPSSTTSLRLSHSGGGNEGVSSTAVTSFPTRSNETGSASHYFALRGSGYVKGFLNELTGSYNWYTDHLDPYTKLPSASVRLGTDFGDGRTGFTTFSMGGGSGTYYEYSSSGELIDEISWLPKSGVHKLKVGGRYAWDKSKYYFFPSDPLLGRYTYLSIEDLVANRPASYERTLNTSARNTRGRGSAVWIGEEWMVSKALQIQGGFRFDFTKPLTIPRYNAVADSVFGIKTDQVPSDVGMTPRLGFSWASKARRGQGSGGSSSLGGLSAASLASMPPELVMSLINAQRGSTLPGIGISGSLGGYRGVIGTSQIADMVEATGLNTRVTLSCVGAAIPTPDWTTMTEGPTACADGVSGSQYSIAKPIVRVFDPGFRAPLSWRGNVGVDGIRVPGKWILSLNGVYAYNKYNQSSYDLNLNRTTMFRLANEGNRPVYVSPNAITSSGTTSSAASRVSTRFAGVTNVVSDLDSYNANINASLAPPRPIFHNRISVNATYTMAFGKNQARGFSSRIGTEGDPFRKEWVQTTIPRHAVRLGASGRVWWFNFSANTFAQSGVPITPMVSGDVNGDGSFNDRAFIPDPATTPDTSLSRQLTELISHARPGAKECLTSQLGRMASANSCKTAWQARIDLTASITPPSTWAYTDRLRLTMNMMNASGALVRLLGLQNTPFGQSPLSTSPQTTLLYVTGFNQATQQFSYRVNKLFGEPSNLGNARRKFAPFQVSLGAEYRLGGPPLNPISRGLGLREPSGQAELTDDQRRAAVARLKKDPTAPIRVRRDSLGITADQVAQLDAITKEFNARADTALVPLTKFVIRKGKRLQDSDLSTRLSVAQSAVAKLTAEYAKKAQGVLTPAQITLLNAAAPPPKKEEK